MFNILKKTLKKEFGYEKYTMYADFIRQGLRESKSRNSEVFNDIYGAIKEKDEEALQEMQERLNESLLSAFHVGRNYLVSCLAYLVAFVLIASYAIQMVAIPGILFISALFLVKTYEFLVNKFCYIDAHMVLIYKAVLDRVLRERRITFH